MTDGMTRFDGGSCAWLLQLCCAGVQSFVSVGCFSLSGVQSASRASASSRRDALHLGGDAVERVAQAQVVAERLEAPLSRSAASVSSASSPTTPRPARGRAPRPPRRRPRCPSCSAAASSTSSRATERGASSPSRATSSSGALARHREVGLERDAARLDLAREPAQQLARARLDERPGRVDVRGGDERVDDVGAELRLDLLLDLLAQARLDVGAQLGERLELGGGARELVVELAAAPSP